MPRKQKTASSPEARENQVIALAYDLAEKQIREGTASAQVITHFLKMGSEKEREERETMRQQRKLMAAKTESLENSKRMENLFSDALKAMREYSGGGKSDDEDD